jgi:Na+-transporting NADH:ubiquinone oxidoreductase subunit NqrF
MKCTLRVAGDLEINVLSIEVSGVRPTPFNIGDKLKVSHPCGDFFLAPADSESGNPIVLISAGVGGSTWSGRAEA